MERVQGVTTTTSRASTNPWCRGEVPDNSMPNSTSISVDMVKSLAGVAEAPEAPSSSPPPPQREWTAKDLTFRFGSMNIGGGGAVQKFAKRRSTRIAAIAGRGPPTAPSTAGVKKKRSCAKASMSSATSPSSLVVAAAISAALGSSPATDPCSHCSEMRREGCSDGVDVLFHSFSREPCVCSAVSCDVPNLKRFKLKPSVLRPIVPSPERHKDSLPTSVRDGCIRKQASKSKCRRKAVAAADAAEGSSSLSSGPPASCAQEARDESDSALSLTIERLTDYLDEAILLPKKMSSMAEMMYT